MRLSRVAAAWAVCACVVAAVEHSWERSKDWNAYYEGWYEARWAPVKQMLQQQGRYVHTFNQHARELCREDHNTTVGSCWETKSDYQHSIVLDTGTHLGKVLYLDCMGQSSEGDEFIYHETLVHLAMTAHPNPKRVLIAGGGEGGTAREVLRHRSVERVVMVDLDASLVEVSRKHLPYWEGVPNDPRFSLVLDDVVAWMNRTEEQFDVIIFDLPDFVKGTEQLYEIPMFELAKSRLSDSNGVVGTHSGGNVCQTKSRMDCRYIPVLLNTYRKVFGHAKLAMAAMPMWEILHGFIIGSGSDSNLKMTGSDIQTAIEDRITTPLRFYSGAMHDLITSIPQDYAAYLRTEHEVMDKAVGDKAPGSVPSDWKSCSCDKLSCQPLDEDVTDDDEDDQWDDVEDGGAADEL